MPSPSHGRDMVIARRKRWLRPPTQLVLKWVPS